jgi:hypothetical protein
VCSRGSPGSGKEFNRSVQSSRVQWQLMGLRFLETIEKQNSYDSAQKIQESSSKIPAAPIPPPTHMVTMP